MAGEAETTRAMARVAGPALIVGGLFVLVRRGELPAIFESFAQDAALGVMAGLVGLIGGLTMLVIHARISTPAAFVLTLLGWLMLARGLLLLFAPSFVAESAGWIVETPYAFEAIGAVVALMGAWLSTVGYSTRPPTIAS